MMIHPTLDIQQPRPFDLVGSRILVAGNAVAFEGGLRFELTEGHDELRGDLSVGSTQLRQFQATIEVPAGTGFKLPQLHLRLVDDGGNPEGPFVEIPVLYGPLILPGYAGYRPYKVKPGDTLAKIARDTYGTPNYHPILAANPHTIRDPNRIFIGQLLRVPVAE